jgi:predicted RNA-binding protein
LFKILKYGLKESRVRDIMCESAVYLEKDGDPELIMENVAKIDILGDRIVCYGLLGERKEVAGVFVSKADLMAHRILLARTG